MRKRYLILFIVMAAFLTGGCTRNSKDTGNSSKQQASDTLYTWRAAMQVYGYQPERALQIIDSAVIVGNMSEVWAAANRARVYSMTQMNEQVDSLLGGTKGAGLEKGKAIGEQLLKHDSLKTNLKLKQEVLDILVYTARQQQDTAKWLQRSRELVDVYHQMGPEKETDALRTEAEIGAALYFSGQKEEGMAMLDSVINRLSPQPLPVREESSYSHVENSVSKVYTPLTIRRGDGGESPFLFNELDALILASKRKIFVLISQGKYVETLPLARRIIERLDDFEQHPDAYNDGSKRVLKDSTSRADYVHYYRAQAENYITAAYASLGELDNMSEAYKQIENSITEATAREHIARYNALQKQLEIERKDAKLSRKNIISTSLVIGLLALIAMMVYILRQHRIVMRKNNVLAREIAEAIKYKELHRKSLTPDMAPPDRHSTTDGKSIYAPSSRGGVGGESAMDKSLSNEELFQYIREAVMRDELFLDPKCDRQMLIDCYGLSKERIGAAFAQGSPFKSVTEFINDCRLPYAAKLLTERPDLSIAEVAEASGFTRVATFIDNFKKRYTLTPTQYRTQNQD